MIAKRDIEFKTEIVDGYHGIREQMKEIRGVIRLSGVTVVPRLSPPEGEELARNRITEGLLHAVYGELQTPILKLINIAKYNAQSLEDMTEIERLSKQLWELINP